MAKKRSYIVVPRTTGAVQNGFSIGGKKIDFKGKTAIHVSDPALAKDIDSVHGLKGDGECWVEQDERVESHMRDEGHKYFFGSTKAFSDGWDRVFGKKK